MIGVLASGSGSNLGALLSQPDIKKQVSVVISNNPDAKALRRAETANVPALLINHRDYSIREEFDQAIRDALVEHNVDWVVLAGFMRIVGDNLLEAFPNRILNIHPALLPAYPGLHGQRQALNGLAKISGCTVHLVDGGVDTGPILAQAALSVDVDDDELSLSKKILRLEHQLYPAVLKSILTDGLTLGTNGAHRLSKGLKHHLSDKPAGVLFSPL
ncbi:MAG: phosphoribosylglycinamide formyltransferase [Myxococcota bacterium]|nr:phosphoribosylglycinamide formyltransferase [Myxococcota bacterium]